MYRIIAALALASALAACDGASTGGNGSSGIGTGAQPLIPEPPPTPTPTPPPSPNKFGDTAALTMNDIDYDPGTGELILNNMTFDDTNPYVRQAAVSAALQGAGSGFDVYRNAAGPDQYFAVFRRTDNAQVAAAASRSTVFRRATDIGGVGAERISGNGALPMDSATYIFTGEYAGVRTLYPDDRNVQEEIQYVTGVSQITVDINDLDDSGSVRGLIVDRTVFDSLGVELSDTGVETADVGGATFIRLDPSSIDFDNWSINSGNAQLVQLTGANAGAEATGTWSGLFAGPRGAEVAGIVIVQGDTPIGIDPVTGEYVEVQVREVGTFVGTR